MISWLKNSWGVIVNDLFHWNTSPGSDPSSKVATWDPNLWRCQLGGGFKYVYFHPYLGKIPILTNIFEMGWNHQLVNLVCWKRCEDISVGIYQPACYLMYSFVKLARDRKYEFSSQRVVKSKGKFKKISGKSRLVKYYSIWPDGLYLKKLMLKTQFHTTEVDFGSVPATCSHHGSLAGLCISVYVRCEPKDQMNHTEFEQCKKPGCLGYIEDYNTQLCGDYYKPL